MGERDPADFCLKEAEGLASAGHYGAALIYLIQAAELIAKGFLRVKRGVRVPYFPACIPYLREAGVVTEGEELRLRQINTMRNLAIHAGLAVSGEDYEEARRHVSKLIEKLRG